MFEDSENDIEAHKGVDAGDEGAIEWPRRERHDFYDDALVGHQSIHSCQLLVPRLECLIHTPVAIGRGAVVIIFGGDP